MGYIALSAIESEHRSNAGNLVVTQQGEQTKQKGVYRQSGIALPGVHLQYPKLSQLKSFHEQPIQRVPAYKTINGLTHLVRMVDGHLYNEDYTRDEVMEVINGMVIEIDTDIKFRSRRGPNQEINSAQDKNIWPPQHRWFKVLSVDYSPVEEDIYVREDTLLDLEIQNQSDDLLGGLEDDVNEVEMERFRTEQAEKLQQGNEGYQQYMEHQRKIYQKHYVNKGTLYKASDVSPEEIRKRDGWKIQEGTNDLEQHLIGLQSIWIATASSFGGAKHFMDNNKGILYIYELSGGFRGIDINGFIDELGKDEHTDRKSNDEIAIETNAPASCIKRYWTEQGGWKNF